VAANLMAVDNDSNNMSPNRNNMNQHRNNSINRLNPRSPMSVSPIPPPIMTNNDDNTDEKARFLNHTIGMYSEDDIPLVSAEYVTPMENNNGDEMANAPALGGGSGSGFAEAAGVAVAAVRMVNQNGPTAAAHHRGLGPTRNDENDEVPLRHRCLMPRQHEQIRQVQQKANLANAKLAQALDLDEAGPEKTTQAMSTYMEAAELYLHALHAVNAGNQNNNNNSNNAKMVAMGDAIKKRLESTLDRVEKLKSGKTLVVIGSNRQGDQKQPPQSQQKQRQLPFASAPAAIPPEPPHTTLTKEEVAILKRASLIASGLFLPWRDQDAALLSKQVIAQQHPQPAKIPLYTDPHGFLPLSSKQKPHFSKWARPSEICRIRKVNGLSPNGVLPKPVMVHSNITPYSIKQQYVTDCSFIASLCICASFERKFRKQLITSIVYPQQQQQQHSDTTAASPATSLVYNPAGKYMVKLWLNGVARCVVIDDYLPIDQYGNLLCSHTTSASSSHLELWVCIIEKAYMKLCGGYDFPGSNSGVDLFSLTGWIPERFHFAKAMTQVRDFETPPERAWERIASASTFGDCLITVSSHVEDLSEQEADKLGLVMGHAYAVLSVIETKNGTRLLQLKNPWAHKGWKGRYSRTDTASWRDAAFRAEVGYNPELAAKNKDDGVFFICWEDILAYFQNFHLSWNPALFGYRATIHGYWHKEQGPSDDTFNVSENPQYVMALSEAAMNKKATIWILISRHVCKHEQAGREVSDYLTVHLHRSKSATDKVYYPGQSGNCVLTGAYTNNPHVLVRYDVDGADDKFLSLVLSQYKKANDLSYTLSCFSTEPFSLGKPQNNLPFTKELSSTLTLNGGPLGSKNVINNPMFALGIPNDDDSVIVQLKVSTSKTVALNIIVMPVDSYGQRMDRATGHAVIDSGKYRHGFSITDRKKMKRGGSYVVLISCYTPGQVASFQVHVSSTSNRVKFEPITASS
jgi:calpain-7